MKIKITKEDAWRRQVKKQFKNRETYFENYYYLMEDKYSILVDKLIQEYYLRDAIYFDFFNLSKLKMNLIKTKTYIELKKLINNLELFNSYLNFLEDKSKEDNDVDCYYHKEIKNKYDEIKAILLQKEFEKELSNKTYKKKVSKI